MYLESIIVVIIAKSANLLIFIQHVCIKILLHTQSNCILYIIFLFKINSETTIQIIIMIA
jgi:hypothetical protein